MNVFDFDGTIYNGDSSIDFYFFCLKKHPIILLKVPSFILATFKYKRQIICKTAWKEAYFSFLSLIPCAQQEVINFWDSHQNKIFKWYANHHSENDVVISASPVFLIKEVCGRIGIQHVIASEVDITTGRFLSKNCHGLEKVYRFIAAFPNGNIETFYSDSIKDDVFMADLAQKAWLVDKGILSPWPKD